MGVGRKYSRIERAIGKWGRGKGKGGKSILLFEGKWKAKFIENQICWLQYCRARFSFRGNKSCYTWFIVWIRALGWTAES